MAKMVFRRDPKGVAALMQSDGMVKALKAYGSQIQKRAGRGYEMDSFIGKNRANVSVYAATPAAVADNLANNTLLKARGK